MFIITRVINVFGLCFVFWGFASFNSSRLSLDQIFNTNVPLFCFSHSSSNVNITNIFGESFLEIHLLCIPAGARPHQAPLCALTCNKWELVIATLLMNNSWINRDTLFFFFTKHDTLDKRTDTRSLFPSCSGTRGQAAAAAAAASKGGRKREASPPAVRTRGGQKSEEPPSKRAKRWNLWRTGSPQQCFLCTPCPSQSCCRGSERLFGQSAREAVSAPPTVDIKKALDSIIHLALIAECKPADLCRNPPTEYFLPRYAHMVWIRLHHSSVCSLMPSEPECFRPIRGLNAQTGRALR